MIRCDCTICNKLGLHARAAAKLVTLASSFECSVQIEHNQRSVNGKSIMGVMMLAASKGTMITIVADGSDEDTAIQEVAKLISNRFDEKC